MAILSDYTAGTVTVSAGGTAVTGVGTAWLTAGFQEGDIFIAADWYSLVASVNSNTSLTLYPVGRRGGALSGAPYRLRYMSDGSRSTAQARELINLLGGSGNLQALGGLASAPNTMPYFTGAGTAAVTPLTAFARSLLDDANAAAFWTTIGATSGPAQAFRRGNILGTVAESGGVPTGAIVERGSNANGEYVRFADGTAMCWSVVSTAYLDANRLIYTWTFPTSLPGVRVVQATFPSAPGDYVGSTLNANRSMKFGASLISPSASAIVIWGPGTPAFQSGDQINNISVVAIGRWF